MLTVLSPRAATCPRPLPQHRQVIDAVRSGEHPGDNRGDLRRGPLTIFPDQRPSAPIRHTIHRLSTQWIQAEALDHRLAAVADGSRRWSCACTYRERRLVKRLRRRVGARSGGANPDEFLDESPSVIGAEDVPQVHDDVSPVGSTGPAGLGERTHKGAFDPCLACDVFALGHDGSSPDAPRPGRVRRPGRSWAVCVLLQSASTLSVASSDA